MERSTPEEKGENGETARTGVAIKETSAPIHDQADENTKKQGCAPFKLPTEYHPDWDLICINTRGN